MEDLTNNINNLEIKEEYESFSIDGKIENFYIKGDDVYRFSRSQKTWVFCCDVNFFNECKRNLNNLKEIYENLLINGNEIRFCIKGNDVFEFNCLENRWVFSGNTIQFIEFKKSLNIIYLPDIKILRKYEKLRKNNGVLERSKDSKVWRRICIFIDNNGKCYNYSIKSCDCYCNNHKDSIVNEKISTIEKGDIIEDWVYDLLCKSDKLINVTNVGRDNGNLDIIFQVKDEINQFRGIQVKQLITNGKNVYLINNLKKYDKDTLIVGVTEDKKYMCLIFNTFIGDLDSFSFNINDYKDKKYIDYIFAGLDDNSLGYTFFNKLIEYCKESTIYNDSQFSKSNLKENKMMKELKKKCEENNLSFDYHTSSDSPIDAIISKKRVQCKYSSLSHSNLYDFGLDHMVDNKLDQPYSENDVDFFIFKHEDEDSFYIIPQNVLLHFGYLKPESEKLEYKTTKKSKGKLGLLIAPSSYEEYHWTKQFADRFDLINNKYDLNKLKNLDNPFDKFQHLCKSNNIKCNRDMSNLTITNGFIGDKTFKLMTSKTKPKKLYIFTTGLHITPYHIKDENVPDFFIFRIEEFSEDFYIFPKDILVEYEIIGSGDKKGKRNFGLPEPTDTKNRKKWVFQYLNNFDLLKDKLPDEI